MSALMLPAVAVVALHRMKTNIFVGYSASVDFHLPVLGKVEEAF